MIKVGIFTFAKAWGGVEKLVLWLMHSLDKEFEFTIITPTEESQCVIKNQKIVRYKEGDIFSLSDVLFEGNFDLIYVPRSLDKTQIEFLRALKKSGVKTRIIAGIHVPLNIFKIDSSKRIYPELIFDLVDSIHLISGNQDNIKHIPPESRDKVEVIENPIMSKKIEFDLKNFNLRILSAGRLSFEKNFTMLVQLAYEFKANSKEIGITVFGDGPEKNKLIRLSKIYGVQDYIIFKNHSDNWLDNIRYGDIFVCTSFYEGYGMALAEAVSTGIPGIGFDFTQGPRDIINSKNGLLIPGQPSVEKLYNYISFLSKRENYDQFFDLNGRYCCNNRIIEKWKQLFYKVYGQKNSIISSVKKNNWNVSEDDIKLNTIKVLKTVE